MQLEYMLGGVFFVSLAGEEFRIQPAQRGLTLLRTKPDYFTVVENDAQAMFGSEAVHQGPWPTLQQARESCLLYNIAACLRSHH